MAVNLNGTPSSSRGRAAARAEDPRDRGTPLRTGISLGRIFGVEVFLDYSLLVIALLVTVNLAMGLLPSWHPEWSRALTWGIAAVAAISFIASVLAHELSHALVGRRMGVPIRAITLFLFGGMAHMEAEPERPRAEFWMAIVGPLTSLVIGVGATFVAFALGQGSGPPSEVNLGELRHFGPIAAIFLWLGPINILLAFFNLIPGFPLDGGRVLRSILWWATGDFQRATRWAAGAGQAVALILIGCGVLMAFGYRIPLLGTGFVSGLWMMLLGWFLNTAAKRSYEQVLLMSALQHVPVWRLMLSRLEAVPPSMTVDEFVHERLLHAEQRCFPVIAGERFLGIVCLADVKKAPQVEWDSTPVAAVMTPAEQLAVVAPDDPATKAADLLTRGDLDQVPVVDGQTLVGLVRRQDLLKWLNLHGPGQMREAHA